MKKIFAIAAFCIFFANVAWSATYLEIYGIATGDDGQTLRSKVLVCSVIKAHSITQEATPSQARIDWAREALENPNAKTELLLNYMLAADNTLTVAQINAATDAQIQTRCDSAIDALFP